MELDFTLIGLFACAIAGAAGLGTGLRMIWGDTAKKPKLTVPSGFTPTLNFQGAWKPELDEKVKSDPEKLVKPEVEEGEGSADLVQLAEDLEKWKREE